MLFRPLITLVVLTINIGNISAMLRHKEEQLVPQNIDPLSQPPTVPLAAAVNHPSHDMHASTHQNPHDSKPHNLNTLVKIRFPRKDPIFNGAKCGTTYYNKRDIIFAREEGCSSMPFYDHNIATVKAVQYYPANPEKYTGTPPFYLFPIGKPILRTRSARYYGFDRIVLNKSCQAVGVLTEWPSFREFASKIGNLLMIRPLQDYDQSRHIYTDCRLL